MELYQTPLDILYLVLTISIALLAILLSAALYHLLKILRNVNRVTSLAENTVELINHYLWQPVKFMNMVIQKTKEKVGRGAERAAKKAKEKE